MRIQKKIRVSTRYNPFRFIVQLSQKEGCRRADLRNPRCSVLISYLRSTGLCVVLYCAASDEWEENPQSRVANPKAKRRKKPKDFDDGRHEESRAGPRCPNSTLRLSAVPCPPFSCWPSRTTRVRACRVVWDVPRDLSIAYQEALSIRGEERG